MACWGNPSLYKPCAAVLQIYDSAEIETQMWWLQFLVKSLLLEQWGLEAEGEIWFKGMVCFVHTILPCPTRAVAFSSAWAP